MDIASSIKKYKNSVTRKYISLSNDEIDVITKGDYPYQTIDSGLFYQKVLNQIKQNKNITIDQGATFSETLTVTTDGSTAKNLTGYTTTIKGNWSLLKALTSKSTLLLGDRKSVV